VGIHLKTHSPYSPHWRGRGDKKKPLVSGVKGLGESYSRHKRGYPELMKLKGTLREENELEKGGRICGGSGRGDSEETSLKTHKSVEKKKGGRISLGGRKEKGGAKPITNKEGQGKTLASNLLVIMDGKGHN